MRQEDIGTLSGQARWTRYIIEGGIAYAGGRPRAPRMWSALPDSLPSLFAQVAGSPGSRLDDRVPALLAFYREFGLLVPIDRVLPAHRRRRGSVRQRGAAWDGYEPPEPRASESIAWALRHASNVRLIMALQYARGAELEDLLAGLTQRRSVAVRPMTLARGERPPRRAWRSTRPDADDFDRTRLVMVPGPREADGVRPLHLGRSAGESDLGFSRRVIDSLLTPQLAHVRRVYDAAEGTPRFLFPHLLDRLYWQLADALGEVREIRQCPCGALFFAHDPRQQVCPPLSGRESRCGYRFRKRRLREKPDG